jgi:tetratricopeptide (TPR) repeat protein
MMRALAALSIASLAVILASPLAAQRPLGVGVTHRLEMQAPTPRAAADTLARLWFGGDLERGRDAAAALTRRWPTEPAVRAWQVLHLARGGWADEADALADSIGRWSPTSPWRHFAKAISLGAMGGRSVDALRHARLAFAGASATPQMQWVLVTTLARFSRWPDAVALVDSLARASATPLWSQLYVEQGQAYTMMSMGPKGDPTARAKAAAAFATAQRLDSTNVDAWYQAAGALMARPGDTTALRLYERAARLAPDAPAIQSAWWRQLRARPDLDTAARRELVVREIEAFLRRRPDSPAAWQVAASAYTELKSHDRARALTERLLREHPTSLATNAVRQSRIRAYLDSANRQDASDPADTARARREAVRLIRDVIAHPNGANRAQLGDAYYNLWWLVLLEDSTVSADSLRRFAETLQRLVRWNPTITHVAVPLRVVELGGSAAWAERLVLVADSLERASLKEAREFMSVAEYAQAEDARRATLYDAIGWIRFHEGRLAEADHQLSNAYALSRTNPSVAYHLGRLAERRGQMLEAQRHYGRGLAIENPRASQDNARALERIYRSRQGSMEGFDAFVEQVKAEERASRRARIAKSRLAKDSVIAEFALERFGAKGVRQGSSELRGKVAMINFWGVWCGPCVAEMPQIQRLHDRYRNDSTVAIVTVDFNDSIETLSEFLARRKLDVPVLLGDGAWVTKQARISAFPTTWFLTPVGTLAFVHIGESDNVFEEFVWRIEMLKAEGAKPAP